MCVSNGAPPHPQGKTMKNDAQKAVQEVWDVLRSYDCVFLGNPGLDDELDKILKKHKVKRGKSSKKQDSRVKDIEKVMKNLVVA